MSGIPCLSRLAFFALLWVLLATSSVGSAQEARSTPGDVDCSPGEPDSVQISWDTPCDSGAWLFEPSVGCRMWDWHPAPEDAPTWTGACKGGTKAGYGVVQWFEHGRPIDRFEGSYVAGRRQGLGRYTWNETDWFDGLYEDDLPHGPGTAHVAGEMFVGQWKRGCLKQGIKVVAIGAPRKSCEAPEERFVGGTTETVRIP